MRRGSQALAVLAPLALLLTAGVVAERDLLQPSLPEAVAPTASSPEETPGHARPHRHAPESRGRVPTMEDALTRLDRRESIIIRADAHFTPAQGVRAGAGTLDDPFVISGWFVDTVLVADTSAHFEFKENYVGRILILDWTGEGGHVHHNFLADLRTNRNVERTGDATAGFVVHNDIRRVEQLRHFDGVLAHNVIGEADDLLRRERVVLDIAGLHAADIHHNTIHGGVDMKIHGHHHGSCTDCHSHNHGTAPAMEHDHTVRHVLFQFRDNEIRDTRFGLRYNDRNHAGDDRTATSETEPSLELPHHHYTTVRITGNRIGGAGLRVDVMNAPDDRHFGGWGLLVLQGNTVKVTAGGHGIAVNDARDAEVLIRGNTVQREGLLPSTTAGIDLLRFRNATVSIEGNALSDHRFGIRARDFDAATTWTLTANRVHGADHAVYWDETVPNPPREE